jgi:hypothetical protein
MDRFVEILHELGNLLGTALHPDKHGVCKLNVNDLLHVQIEFQPERERLLLACMICEIPAGKFRENILKDSLRANWPYPLHGTLSYSEKNNHLCLFEYLSTENLTGQKLLDALNAFIAKADSWRLGVQQGDTNSLIPTTKKSESGIFGLKKST